MDLNVWCLWFYCFLFLCVVLIPCHCWQVFEPFGPVELVQLPADIETGQSKGFGFVQVGVSDGIIFIVHTCFHYNLSFCVVSRCASV